MQKKQATGIDTRMMMPVYAALFGILCQLFLPWISIPALKNARLPVTYNLFHMGDCVSNIQQWSAGGHPPMEPCSTAEVDLMTKLGQLVTVSGCLMAVLLCFVVVTVLWKRSKGLLPVRVVFSLHLVWTIAQFVLVWCANLMLNSHTGRSISFQTMTIQSYVQLTSWVYAQMFLSLGMILGAKQFLVITLDETPPSMQVRCVPQDRRFGRRTQLSLVLLILGIPLTILFGIYFLNDRSAVFIGLCIICLSMLPFAMVFEDRHPQARELLLIAVLSAIAVAGRAAFFMVPQFKPTAAIIIIAGIALGPEAGFLTGTISGFVSNFFFGQGPWTPWQMFSFGIIGFLAGLLFARRNPHGKHHRLALCVYGGVSVLLIYGILMDVSGLIGTYGRITWAMVLAHLVSGFYFNLIHAAATVIFLFLLAEPMERKLNRIKQKYGLMEV